MPKMKQGKVEEKWPFYDSIDAVLGHKPATAPSVVTNTSEDHQNAHACADDNEDKSLFTTMRIHLLHHLLSDSGELESTTRSTGSQKFNPSCKRKAKRRNGERVRSLRWLWAEWSSN